MSGDRLETILNINCRQVRLQSWPPAFTRCRPACVLEIDKAGLSYVRLKTSPHRKLAEKGSDRLCSKGLPALRLLDFLFCLLMQTDLR